MLDTSYGNASPTSGVARIDVAGGQHGCLEGEFVIGRIARDLPRIEATAGEQLTVELKNAGTLPKEAMGHNWVLLKKGADPVAFSTAAMQAKATDYIPAAQAVFEIGPLSTADCLLTLLVASGPVTIIEVGKLVRRWNPGPNRTARRP